MAKNEINRLHMGKLIAQYLNLEKPGPARTEVEKIFELSRQVDRLQREYDSDMSDGSRAFAERLYRRNAKLRSILSALNRALDHFAFSPQMYIPLMTAAGSPAPVDKATGWTVGLEGGHVAVSWKPQEMATFKSETYPAESIVKTLLELTEMGALSRIRQCFCGKWFYAESNKKEVCSDACRARKFNTNNPTYHQQHAKKLTKGKHAKTKKR